MMTIRTCVAFCALLALLVLPLNCVRGGTVRVDSHCGGVLLSSTSVLTSAHCVLDKSTPAQSSVSCDGERVAVMQWQVHPEYNGSIDHDLAIGELARELKCYKRVDLGSVRSGETVVFRGFVGAVEEVDDQTIIVDIEPKKFCRGDSGLPMFDDKGRVVAIVSRWWAEGFDNNGCSFHIRAVDVVANEKWIKDSVK